jgi:hypothetical protein
MPIPLIVWGVVAGTCAAVGVISTGFAAGRVNDAQKKYCSRRRRYEEAMQQCEEKHRYASQQFEDLGKIRLEAVVTLGKAVAFLEKAKLKDRKLFEKCNITPEQLVEWRTASVHAVEILGGVASSALSGVATSVAVYGLVGTLGSAGTGAAIGTLSGAAATNATLAWLGGGTIAAGGGGVAAGTVVLGGLVVGPAILVASFFAHAKAGDIENKVERHISEMDIDEANKWKLVGALDAVLARVTELKETTLNVQRELEELLSISTPENESDAYMVAKIAVSLGQLLEIAILDKEGKIV